MKEIKLRIAILVGGFSFFAFCILIQAFRLQVVDILPLKKNLTKITIPCKRGFIYDRYREELAITVQKPSLYACPNQITDPYTTAKRLSKILHIKTQKLLKKLKRKGEFIWIKRWLSQKEAEKIEKLNIKGLAFKPENCRRYPHSFLGGQVLGFVGLDGKGLEGIECKFDYLLKGKPGYYFGIKDARGHITLSPRLPIQSPKDGHNLYLTLDYQIQYVTEEALKKAVRKWHAKSGCAVVIVPQTGEILALANYPPFDPNYFWKANPNIWRNRAITDAFEPGSTFKPILLAAALNEKIWSRHDIIYGEKGRYKIKGAVFHDVKPFGWMSVEHAVIYSSNIGMVKIGEKVGKECFYQYIKKFGFGEKTGIHLPGEASGLIRPLKKWTEVDTDSACFGQGLAVTALQLTLAYAAIANKGTLMYPMLIKNIKDAKGKEIKIFKPRVKRSVISPQTASLIKNILHKVVEKGTGQMAAIPGYKIAGKTGTAQKIDPRTGKYQKNKYISSFVGFFPVDHPRAVISIIINEPKGMGYGGIVAAPVFKEIAEHLIWQWQIPPSSPTMRMVENTTSPSTNLKTTQNITPPVVTDGIMPDLRGLPLRLAFKILQDANIKVKIKGTGKVVKQIPPPGSKIKNNVCLLQLEAN